METFTKSMKLLNRCSLKEAYSLERLLGFKLASDLNWKMYIQPITKNA